MPCVGHKPLNGIQVSKVAKLQSRILTLQVAQCQFGWIKMWKKPVKSYMRTQGIGHTINNI
jgi:hypothetical protein